MAKIILFNKPYDVLCQFTDGAGRATLANFIAVPGVYAAGRLDRDSEGLVVLTDDGRLQHRISDPRHKLEKSYWVQVEGVPDDGAQTQLQNGGVHNDGPTAPAGARVIAEPALWPRIPSIRQRAIIRHALHLHPIGLFQFMARIADAVLQTTVICEHHETFAVAVESTGRIHARHCNEIGEGGAAGAVGELAEHVVRFVEQYDLGHGFWSREP